MYSHTFLVSISSLLVSSLVFSGCTSDSVTIDFSSSGGNVPNVDAEHIVYNEWTAIDEHYSDIEFKQHIVDKGAKREKFSLVRFNPAEIELRVAVDTAHPRTVTAWNDSVQALAIINGSFFTEDYDLTTRTVVDGESYGPLLSGQTGFVRVVDGTWEIITSNDERTGIPQYSVQSYPVLVHNGAINVQKSSDDTAQRTIIARDNEGWLYFIVAEYGVLTLRELAEVLVEDIPIHFDAALNLDGGTSTGITVQGSEIKYDEMSTVVPSVLYIAAE